MCNSVNAEHELHECHEFGLRLKEAREAAGLTGYRLAKMMDVQAASVHHWEHGRSYPRIDKLILISELLKVSIDWLLLGEKANGAE